GGLHRDRHRAADRTTDNVRRPLDATRSAVWKAHDAERAHASAGQREHLQRVQRERQLRPERQLRSVVAAAIAAPGWPYGAVQRHTHVLTQWTRVLLVRPLVPAHCDPSYSAWTFSARGPFG